MIIHKRVIDGCVFGGLVNVKLCTSSAAIDLRYFPLFQPTPCRLYDEYSSQSIATTFLKRNS